MKKYFKLLVSREARIIPGRHAWNRRDEYAFGILLGVRYRLLLALPAASVRSWADFNLEAFEAFYLLPARQLAASLHLDVLGRYITSDYGTKAFETCPFKDDGLLIHYQMICCPQCSGARYYFNGQELRWADVEDAPGKRITHLMNQRRILTRWNRMLGRRSYLDSGTLANGRESMSTSCNKAAAANAAPPRRGSIVTAPGYVFTVALKLPTETEIDRGPPYAGGTECEQNHESL